MKFKKIMLITFLLVAMLSISMVSASQDADNLANDNIITIDVGEEVLGEIEDDFQGYVNEENVDINDINETEGVSFYCPEGYSGNVTIDFPENPELNIIYPVNESVWNTSVKYNIPDLGISETGRYDVDLIFYNVEDEEPYWLTHGFINVVDYTKFWVNVNISFGWPQPIDLDIPYQLYYPVGSAGKAVTIRVEKNGESISNMTVETTINDTSGFIDFTWSDLSVHSYDLSIDYPNEYKFIFSYDDEVFFEDTKDMSSPLYPWSDAYIGGKIDAQTVAAVVLDPRISDGQVIISIDGTEFFNKNLSEIYCNEIGGGPNRGRYEYQVFIEDLNTAIEEGNHELVLTFTNENCTVSDEYPIRIHDAKVVTDNDTNISIIILSDEVIIENYNNLIQLVTPLNTSGNLIICINDTEFFNVPLSELEDFTETGDGILYYIRPDLESMTPGTYDVNVTFSNDNTAVSNRENITFISIISSGIVSDDILWDDDINYFAYVTILDGYEWDGEVMVLLNGTEYFNKNLKDFDADHYFIDEDKIFYIITPAYLDMPVEPGTYDVEIQCPDYEYMSENVTFYDDNINIDAPDVSKYFGGPERFFVNVTDNAGNPIANASVNITINGKTYVKSTDDNGTASIALGLNSGAYEVITKVNATEVSSTVTINPTVSGENVTKMFKNDTQYYATFVDTTGKTLANNTEVEFNINGVFYKRYTNENGTARMNINLNPGEYIITAKNPNSGEMYTNIIIVLPTIVENHNLTKYYKNDSQYSLKILDNQGNPVGAGVNVTLNINGVFYTKTTNASGYVNMNINLAPGKYIITAEYNGLRASNNIEVLSVMETKDLSMKYKDGSKFEVKLLDGQGNPYANQTVSFNINGVFYNRTTESDGIARLNINLMAGEYIITSTYNGLNAANKVTISS